MQDHDQGCPVCDALPDDWCTTPDGRMRPDHAARIREREQAAAEANEGEGE